ncbi:DUF6319 family protein [Pseudonocardia lacus]|uniref:DUF6319 family protein n=1 Tax=Pseudonocardia lacus TaxID=2835865 RepID=UPI001BDCC20C|nr:DUF6319 family protein [Pseudonocardia lacus]
MTTPEQPTATDPAEQATPAKGAGRAGKAALDTAPAAPDTESAAESAAEGAGEDAAPEGEAAPEKRRRGRPKGSTARTTRTIELILTVSGTVDGDWQAELKQGSAWLSRGLPVSAAAVASAARELHPELADPIDAAIGAAREQRAARVAALEAELEQARKALAEIDG